MDSPVTTLDLGIIGYIYIQSFVILESEEYTVYIYSIPIITCNHTVILS